ncbi:MAG TPA: hypothetical protein ENN12_03870 [Epsilonproteobacteria bacterium]|nr:hypothetical protein [Campylobacterota bacterium]
MKSPKISRVILLSSIVSVTLFGLSGCTNNSLSIDKASNKIDRLESQGQKYLHNSPPYEKSLITVANEKMNKTIKMSCKNMPVYLAVRRATEHIGLKFDTTFTPSKEYKITTNFNGTFNDFIEMVYNQTGVQYKYRNGLITVFNKEYIDKEYRAKTCSMKGAEKIEITLRAIPPIKVFDYFIENRNFDVTYDTKYVNLTQNEPEKEALSNVNFFYKGCDEKEAIIKFATANNLSVEFTGDKAFTVRDYEFAKFDIPSYFTMSFTSSGSGVGENAETGTSLSENEDFRKEFKDLVATYLSEYGRAYLSNRGYLVVTDRPKAIKEIKKIVQKELLAQQSMDLSVSIIRVSVNDTYQGGIDWSLALRELGKDLGVRNLNVGLSYANGVEGGLGISGIINNKEQIVKVLSKYGNTKITRDYSVSTRSGMLSTLKSVQKIPYVTTSVVMDGQTAVTTAEAKEAEAGIVINIKPTLSRNNELVNFSIDATVSEYLGDKVFKVNGGDYVLPQLAANKIQMAATVPMDQTVILTGLKLKNAKNNNEGVPGLSKLNIIGGAFGSDKKDAEYSEFLLLLTPTAAKRI